MSAFKAINLLPPPAPKVRLVSPPLPPTHKVMPEPAATHTSITIQHFIAHRDRVAAAEKINVAIAMERNAVGNLKRSPVCLDHRTRLIIAMWNTPISPGVYISTPSIAAALQMGNHSTVIELLQRNGYRHANRPAASYADLKHAPKAPTDPQIMETPDREGDPWIAARHLCESIGIDFLVAFCTHATSGKSFSYRRVPRDLRAHVWAILNIRDRYSVGQIARAFAVTDSEVATAIERYKNRVRLGHRLDRSQDIESAADMRRT